MRTSLWVYLKRVSNCIESVKKRAHTLSQLPTKRKECAGHSLSMEALWCSKNLRQRDAKGTWNNQKMKQQSKTVVPPNLCFPIFLIPYPKKQKQVSFQGHYGTLWNLQLLPQRKNTKKEKDFGHLRTLPGAKTSTPPRDSSCLSSQGKVHVTKVPQTSQQVAVSQLNGRPKTLDSRKGRWDWGTNLFI